MDLHIYDSAERMGEAAAQAAAAKIRGAIAARGSANLIVATGASQFTVLANLVKLPVDWSRVTVFHLDEYIGLPESHPASFRRYLKERFAANVSGLKEFNYVNGEAPDPQAECARLGAILRDHPIDVALVGIGENAHLAFNDPPANFETEAEFLVVALDDACRRQQFGEGWFPTFDAVPTHALTMSIRQIVKSAAIICSVPDQRKAVAVRNSVEGPVSSMVPASILQHHPECHLFLDTAAASLLSAGRKNG